MAWTNLDNLLAREHCSKSADYRVKLLIILISVILEQ